jgi:RNA recognition motif-containing protein
LLTGLFRVYVRNLNEKIKIPELKTKLREEFSPFGEVLDVIAHKNLRMRGQAFVVFSSVAEATKAQTALGTGAHELFGQRIEVQFAKTKSDATIAQAGNEEALEKHKRRRLAEKELRQVESSKRQRTDAAGHSLARGYPSTSVPAGPASGGGSSSHHHKKAAKKDQLDFLPPNKVLFLQELPAGVTQSAVETVFKKFSGFVEVRLMAVRRLGFVEFERDEDAVAAKEATSGLVLDGSAVRITYAKK